MNELQIFQYNNMEVRTTQQDGEPWFVLADVCKVLDIKNPSQLADRLDEDERAMLDIGRQGQTWVISESGLYAVILRSDKPEAKPFRKWVTAEVLPSIRKNGGYIKGQKGMAPEELLAQALLVAQRTLERQETALKALEEENHALRSGQLYGPPVSSWSPSELSRMLACALEQGQEGFITVLYLGYYLGLTPAECFAMETETARLACEEGVLPVRGRGKLPLNDILIQRLRRHLTLDSPGRRLLIPDRRWMSQSVQAFQAFLEAFWPLAQDKSRSAGHTNVPCLRWAPPV